MVVSGLNSTHTVPAVVCGLGLDLVGRGVCRRFISSVGLADRRISLRLQKISVNVAWNGITIESRQGSHLLRFSSLAIPKPLAELISRYFHLRFRDCVELPSSIMSLDTMP